MDALTTTVSQKIRPASWRALVKLKKEPSLGQASRQGLGFPLTGGRAQAAPLGTTSLQLVLLAFQGARGAESLVWLSMDHMMLLVSGCSISSKSRCSHGAGRLQRASSHLAMEGGRLLLCWLQTSCQPRRPLCRAPASSLDHSPSALALVLRAVSTWPWEQRGSAVPANRSPLIS